MILENKQLTLRRNLLSSYLKVNAGHIGCSLSCIDILISIFYHHKTENDTFILSKGHAANALYTVLNDLGEITSEEITTYYQNGTTLPAHPAANKYKSIPFATGSLGHGFPIATGIAKAKKLKAKSSEYVYVVMSDGETNEGTTWEAAHFAVSNQLDNLIVVIDKNNIQGFGYTKDILGDTANLSKWESIGFEVIEADGHNLSILNNTISALKNNKNGKPKLFIAKTIKGKGVSFMEDTVDWHYLPMSDEQYKKSLEDINIKYSA